MQKTHVCNWRQPRFWLLVIMLIAIIPRFFLLGEIPFNLNRDEASIGYNAYSLLHTGQEEHGVAWPINVESFGDWKLPGYIYATIPAVAMFGLTPWAIKLPAAIAGVMIVGMTYLLLVQLLRQYGSQDEARFKYLPIVASLVVAISPWAIHLSRLTYEANLALALFLSGWWLVERSKQHVLQEKNYRSWWMFLGGVMLLSLTVFTYHSYQVFLPLFALVWAGFNFQFMIKVVTTKLPLALLVATILGGLMVVLFIGSASHASAVKFSGLSIWETGHYREQLYLSRRFLEQAGVPAWLQSLVINTYTLKLKAFATNLIAVFSPGFLFVTGGSHRTHNFSGIANFHLAEVFFLLGGCLLFLRRFHRQLPLWLKLLGWWLLVAAIAPAITVDPTHSVRFLVAMPALATLIALGIITLVQWRAKLIIPALLVIYAFSLWQWSWTYYIVAPNQDYTHTEWLMPRLASAIKPIATNYDQIYIPLLKRSPYIFLLFYWQTNPTTLATDLEYLPPDDEGFTYASRLGNIDFTTAPSPGNEERRRLLFLFPEADWSLSRQQDPRYSVREIFADERDEQKYYLVDFQPSVLSREEPGPV